MKEAIEFILKQLPLYLITFVQVISSPKKAIRERNSGSTEDLSLALVFVAVSILFLYPVGKAISTRTDEFWLDIAKTLTTSVFLGLAAVAILAVSWRIVGGKAPFQKLFVAYCYMLGVFAVVGALASLVPFGYLHAFYPETYNSVVEAVGRLSSAILDVEKIAEKNKYLESLPGFFTYMVLQQVISFAILGWLFYAWGTFREIQRLSKPRSAIALLIFIILSLPLAAISYTVQEMVFGPQQLRSAPTPNKHLHPTRTSGAPFRSASRRSTFAVG